MVRRAEKEQWWVSSAGRGRRGSHDGDREPATYDDCPQEGVYTERQGAITSSNVLS